METAFDRNHSWQQNRIWESIPVQVGEECFNLHERYGCPHLLFAHDDQKMLTDFMLAFLSDAADRYSPDDIRFFVIDMGDGRLYRQAQNLPHFTGGIQSDTEWNGAMYLLGEETRRRSALVRNQGRDGYACAKAYHKAYHEGTVSEPLPQLLVLVNGCDHYGPSTVQQYAELTSIIRQCRSLNVNQVMAVNTTEWDSMLATNTRQFLLKNIGSQQESWRADAARTLSAYRTDPALQRLKQRLLLDDRRWHWDIRTEDGEAKTLELICGNLCDLQSESDVVVCSAFKGDYIPSRTSLIGALSSKRGIDVEQLAQQPELDFRSNGCWLSRDTGTAYRRIACVELISFRDSWRNEEQAYNTIIQKSFSTLRYLLEQAYFSSIQVNTIALPLLGTGNQGIDLTFVSTPLLTQCKSILQTNPGVQCIRIYEQDADKASAMAELMTKMLAPASRTCQVFISYSSKQEDIATDIRNTLESNSISCWMAPDSIPTGDNYLSVIPLALEQVDVLLLILTPDSESSRWVQKEVGSAVGADKKLLPYQLERFELTKEFRFLLNGEQIMYRQEPLMSIIPSDATANRYPLLVAEVQRLLAEKRPNTL
ncbi:MAG: TIR domain-containing protein [Oscillospiraceae bacterium]|nr:TIR domain-containing protein [Oscillospiraceae bacterium]